MCCYPRACQVSQLQRNLALIAAHRSGLFRRLSFARITPFPYSPILPGIADLKLRFACAQLGLVLTKRYLPEAPFSARPLAPVLSDSHEEERQDTSLFSGFVKIEHPRKAFPATVTKNQVSN